MNTMDDLKDQTLIPANILVIDGYYRYVNHTNKLVSTGFPKKENLLKWTDCIRFDKATVQIMQDRYKELFEK